MSHGPRAKVLVAVTFPFFPPVGGGRLRVFHLYRLLARVADVHVVCLTPPGLLPREKEVAPGLWEVRVPQSHRHASTELLREKAAGTPVTDVVFSEMAAYTPEFGRTLERLGQDADLLVACHPYVHDPLRACSDAPLWYESHNCEVDLKRLVLPESRVRDELLAEVRRVEAASCHGAELITCCSPEDRRELIAEYGVPDHKLRVVPNGVVVDDVPYTPVRRRRAHRAALGLSGEEVRALFVGSWHGPNIEAARHLVDLAGRNPSLRLWIAGSVGEALTADGEDLPGNVELFGVLPDAQKDVLLSLCDVALNPVETGSGTNLKMFEYLATGAPVVTTPRGMRGIEVDPGPAVAVADVEDLPAAIEQLVHADAEAVEAHTEALRAQVRAKYDWTAVVDALLDDEVVRHRLRLGTPAATP